MDCLPGLLPVQSDVGCCIPSVCGVDMADRCLGARLKAKEGDVPVLSGGDNPT